MILTINKNEPEKEIDYNSYIEKRSEIVFLTKKIRRSKMEKNNRIKNEFAILNNKNENMIETFIYNNRVFGKHKSNGIT